MKYYIQGSPARSKEIKAAFERLGLRADGYDFSRIDVLFFTFEAKGKTYMMSSCLGTGLDNIILTHQDYKELELPVEPKFKVGDWVACIDDEGDMATEKIVTFLHNKVLLVDTDGCLAEYSKTELSNFHLWSIQDAKDGDVLATDNGWTCIFKAFDGLVFSSYCFMDSQKWFCEFGSEAHTLDSRVNGNIHPATKEQRDLLFAKMKEAGYEWDCEKKELRKIIKPKFKVGDVVLYYGGLYRVGDVLYTKKNGSFYNIGNLVRVPEIQLTLADHRDEIRILKGGEQ